MQAQSQSGEIPCVRAGLVSFLPLIVVLFIDAPQSAARRQHHRITTLYDELGGKCLSMFKEALPRMSRVALLVPANAQEDIDQYQTAKTRRPPRSISLDVAVCLPLRADPLIQSARLRARLFKRAPVALLFLERIDCAHAG